MKTILLTLMVFIFSSCQITDLDKRIEKIAVDNNFSGTVLIAIKDSIILNNAYGYSDKKKKIKNTPITVFPIAAPFPQPSSRHTEHCRPLHPTGN